MSDELKDEIKQQEKPKSEVGDQRPEAGDSRAAMTPLHSESIVNSKLKTQNSKLALSVYMITLNNGTTIEKALASVAGWASELVVIDSESSDGTKEIVTRYTGKLYQFATTSQREKYQHAQDKCTSDWVLFIDADEWLTDSVKKEIEATVSGDTAYTGFIVGRRNYYLGRLIAFGGWYPDEEIRLYRKDSGRWEGGLHAKVHVEGKVGRLKNYYLHTPYNDISHQIRTVDRYSGAFAEDLRSSGRSFHLFNMLTRPMYRFFRDYIFKKGFLDGVPGVIIVASTMYYVFMKHAKLWEMEKRDEGLRG
jgi:glycosyltransferase involved in cell wall biosynthesis